MSYKKLTLLTLVMFLICVLAERDAFAQCPVTTFSAGLKAPNKVLMTPAGQMLVAEAGNGANTGRVSVIDRRGNRRTLIDNLPSGFAPPSGDPSGPSGLALRGRTIYILIGSGDATQNGPAQGTEVPNANASSPILSSILKLQLNADVESGVSGFALTFSDQTNLKNGATVNLSSATGDSATIKLLADFPDYTANPSQSVPNGVRASNPFSIELAGDQLYVTDASQNTLLKIDSQTGATSTLANFPPVQNTLPFGPPVSEAVPDNVHFYKGQLLVTLLTGFPFPPGKAGVRSVDPGNGSTQTLFEGLRMMMDVMPIGIRGGTDLYLTLEFSADPLAQQSPPGLLKLVGLPNRPPVVISDCLITPTSMARDTRTGDIFVTEIFTGRLMRVSAARVFVRNHYLDFLNREPDQGGWDYWTNQIEMCGDDVQCLRRRRTDVSAAFFIEQEFQQSGFFLYRLRVASLGAQPDFAEYTADRNQLGAGTDADRKAFSEAFVQRGEFLASYPAGMNGSDFINALLNSIKQNSGVDLSAKRQELASEYVNENTQAASRARVLRKLIGYSEYSNAEYNRAFVLSEYFGYLQRDSDAGGYSFWLNVLNNREPGNYRGMVCSYITSAEYQQRTFPIALDADMECGQ
ncbi:MAG TPA: ScyD/ScyE family protein [Pyrinomonadaceae bacterium]|nr:ScyD/ScyE family protein [Pyrinomonadaceae bacterium]